MTILNNLPPEHPLRNTPLGEINAEYLAGEPARWKSLVTPNRYRIASVSFNALGPSWTESGHRLFRAKTP